MQSPDPRLNSEDPPVFEFLSMTFPPIVLDDDFDFFVPEEPTVQFLR